MYRGMPYQTQCCQLKSFLRKYIQFLESFKMEKNRLFEKVFNVLFGKENIKIAQVLGTFCEQFFDRIPFLSFKFQKQNTFSYTPSVISNLIKLARVSFFRWFSMESTIFLPIIDGNSSDNFRFIHDSESEQKTFQCLSIFIYTYLFNHIKLSSLFGYSLFSFVCLSMKEMKESNIM